MRSLCMSLLMCGALWSACQSVAANEVDGREHDQIEAALKGGLLEIWFPRCLDHENGGFLCDFDSQWRPAGKQPKWTHDLGLFAGCDAIPAGSALSRGG